MLRTMLGRRAVRSTVLGLATCGVALVILLTHVQAAEVRIPME